MKTFNLSAAIRVLLFFFLLFGGLFYAKSFLVPIVFAGLLSMLFLGLSTRMEKKGLNRAFAALLCILLLVALFAGVAALLGWQVAGIAEDAGKIKQNVSQTIVKVQEQITSHLGIPAQKQQQIIEKQKNASSGNATGMATSALGAVGGALTNIVLVLVYIFLFMYFRGHLKKFILKLVPEDQKHKTGVIIQDTTHVAQQYLGGLAMMIGCLWVMYGIGYSVIGLKHALFFAVLCGLLEIVPFIGNLLGTSFALLMAFAQGGGGELVIGVLVVYAIVQFIQTYLLEPLVVGAEVNINPLFTILVLVLGETIWGIPGMVVAIPLLAIVKIICDNVEPLKPYGFLIGTDKKRGNKGITEKIKAIFNK